MKWRKEYVKRSLRESTAGKDPHKLFKRWFTDASSCGREEPNAAALATATMRGKPSVRMVLLKSYSNAGFIFYSNYNSVKGRELALNPQAALLFYWEALERQIRISGRVSKISKAESDEYFENRPRGAQIAAIVSRQSSVLPDRERLERAWRALGEERSVLHRPQNWGGYILRPLQYEFWQGGENRLHDRLLYKRRGSRWIRTRLAP